MAPPTFLVDEPAYKLYLEKGAAGSLVYPAYDLDDNGDIIVIPGEAFCRVDDCIVAKSSRDTRNLRAHITKAHGLSVSKSQTGNISLPNRQASRDWFRTLMRNDESEEEEEEQQQEEEEEEEEAKPPIPLTATRRVSKVKTRLALIQAGHATLHDFPCPGCQDSSSANNCPANPHICDFHQHFNVSDCISYQ
ncbi:uncharacterized protein N7446_003941 [Penicillium canescens]|uniref:Uncharacterized protein n=1 Tax=Penicillium canescens TaxID=5083 RepID=A0AAD6I285_PENCN|nr:uncharacterized protein N7446_003941 [Penicillium canescens]KAJ6027467.1 hypothetical protein N7460_012284 [Penicillium canescens]KAJ6040741.1 hypothetical protein N7444_009646 [Penicillium canescens]KAJ6066904.1 hypothetical protein N7446_003941 [Penicillium canescens]